MQSSSVRFLMVLVIAGDEVLIPHVELIDLQVTWGLFARPGQSYMTIPAVRPPTMLPHLVPPCEAQAAFVQ